MPEPGSTGSAGRFGTRYGRVARRRVSEIEAETEAASCPECGGDAERSGTGIWACADCGHEFTGGSYRAETPAGRGVERSLREALAEDEES